MSNVFPIDFETFGVVQLSAKKKDAVGLYNYATHPQTCVLMMGYRLPWEKERRVWCPHEGPMPENVRELLLNPKIKIGAFNSAFERYVLQYVLGITIPPSRFLDSQIGCRVLAIPSSLEEACDVLDVPEHLKKDKRGEELIALFCEPKKNKKRKGQEATTYRNDWNTHPKEWDEFRQYCIQDVAAEEEVSRRMHVIGALPLSPFEQQVWEFDQKVNDRGIPVDVQFVSNALALAERHKEELLEENNRLTGLDNANSGTQFLPWARERGYPLGNLRKEAVEAILKDPDVKLDDLCRKVLSLRVEAGSTSYTKLKKILLNVCPDARLRNQFVYLGSSRCGRWSGNSVQIHNFPRPNKVFEDQKNVIRARELVYTMDYDTLKSEFGSVLLTIKNLLRTVFVANAGNE